MPAIKGSLVILRIGDGASPEVFTRVAGGRNVTYSLGGDDIDVTTADDVDASGATWATFISGVINFSVSMDGILKDKAAYDELITLRLTGATRNFEVVVTDFGTFAGPMVVTSIEGAGPFSDAATYSIQLRAAAPVEWTVAA